MCILERYNIYKILYEFYIYFRAVVDAVEVCGNVWLVDAFQYAGYHSFLWNAAGWLLLLRDGVGMEVEGVLKVSKDELRDLRERFSCCCRRQHTNLDNLFWRHDSCHNPGQNPWDHSS